MAGFLFPKLAGFLFYGGVEAISIFAPAKLNLFLAITNRRTDGFHELVSVVVRTRFGDLVRAEPADGFSLACDDPAVPVDATNLVLKAAAVFVRKTGWSGGARFFLEKRVPMGAGLGGGSSDAVAALRALRKLAGVDVTEAAMNEMAAELGSDCPLFLRDGPIVMRGRGERVEVLPESAVRRLKGRRVLIFKPEFGIATAWAYAQLAARAPGSYLPAADAEARLERWLGDDKAPAEALLYNNMEAVADAKFLALPVLLEQLRREFGLAPRMSGSGSACFSLLPDTFDAAPVIAAIRAGWGDSAFVVETWVL